jgi:acyl-CoA synthetase (AMP-forming)/AMP-acid ligase II
MLPGGGVRAEVARRSPPRSNYRPLLLSGGLHASAERTPRKPALICEGDVRTYGELAERVRRVCGGAIASGIVRGDRVAILAPNCIEYAELVIGLSDAGAMVATLSARSTTHELAAACDDCGARFLFVHASLADTAQPARLATVERVFVIGTGDYEAWLASAPQAAPIAALEETDPFTLVYSSGTTGKPKGIVISHRSRTLTFHGMAMEYGVYGPDDLQLGIAPMAHGAGFAFIMASLYFGGTVDVLPRFDPEKVLEKLACEPFTGVFMVPTHFQAIFAVSRAVLERNRGRAQTLRAIISNAAALPQAVKEEIVAYFGTGRLHETYGSTEAGIVTNLRPRYQLTHRQSVGPPFALNSVRLLGEDCREVERGRVGELFSRSPYLFNGYFERPAETAEAVKDGWVTAGDLARQDDDGFYYIVDRKKDMVVTGGINVYPREIEEVLHRCPDIVEAAVVGVPDGYFGEALQAFVVARAGSGVGAADLDAHCRATLSAYKVPKTFEFVSSLPRNAGGKILKNELRRRHAEVQVK